MSNIINVYEGNALKRLIPVVSISSSDPYQENSFDITGWTAKFIVREEKNSTDIVLEKEITTIIDNQFVLQLDTTDTNIKPDTYHYEISMEKDGEDLSPATIIQDLITIERSIIY